MKPLILLSLPLFMDCASGAMPAAEDPRELIQMPAPMARHMLGNMRDHLQALTEIQRAVGSGDFDRAGQVAEQRLGLSSLQMHGAAHMAAFMPKAMQDIGTAMHKAASQFALVVQETGADGNVQRSVAALARVTEQCVACHQGYRAH
jgi:hypothetical protein